MSAIRFLTTPKGYLPQYSYILGKPEPLDTEINNVACYWLGTMLHLDIQKGNEAMKTLNFQKYIGGTAACMKRLMMVTKGCGQLTSNDTYFANSWFSGVKMAEEAMAEGVDYCGPVKTSHKGFCLAILEKLIKYFPAGSYLVLRSTPRVPGDIPLMAIGYKYISRKVLGFIATDGDGSTEPCDTYSPCFPDIYSNVSVHYIFCPRLLGRYLNACDEIDNQNRIRQSDLALEKYWVTHSGYFRLAT